MFLTSGAGCAPEWMSTFGGHGGVTGTVRAMAVFDDGSGGGPALYVGGKFTGAGGIAANRIARWDGQSWSALGAGLNNDVLALSVFDDGSGAGPALYVGGLFVFAGGQSARYIARWTSQGWSTVQNGVNSIVSALAVFDDGSGGGAALYAGGAFTRASGPIVNHVARWDGQAWSALGNGTSHPVYALGVHDDGSGDGPALYAGGAFTHADGLLVNRIARWDGQGWNALGGGMDHYVRALAVFDDPAGGGATLCAGGRFLNAGGQPAKHIATWDGQTWSELGGGVNSTVWALAMFDDASGSGPALYVGGDFDLAGGQAVNRIARWDGQAWGQLAQGSSAGVRALTVFDDGSGGGPELYAGGWPDDWGGQAGTSPGKWDGQVWSSPQGQPAVFNDWVIVLKVFDDGSGGGPALYVGGTFREVDGLQVNGIARWDGQSWSALGSGMNGWVGALEMHDDGSGPALYAGGGFSHAGGVLVKHVAKWDGQVWSDLDGGVDGWDPWYPEEAVVSALTVFDDGSGGGPQLYLGGNFQSGSQNTLHNLAK